MRIVMDHEGIGLMQLYNGMFIRVRYKVLRSVGEVMSREFMGGTRELAHRKR